jgi:hypothetical protein
MRCFRESAGADADAILAEFIGGIGAEAFWRQVEANLRSGRIVIIFVADAISPTLRRIVEFLNEQMRPAEVLAIEVEQFVNPNGQRTLVPRLLGQTERSQAAKAVAEERPPISEQQWFEFLAVSKGDALAKKAREIADWLRSAGFFVGITDRQDSLFARITKSDGNFSFPFFIRRSSGRLDTSLQNLKFTSSFSSDEARAKLLAQMRSSFPSLVSTSKVTGWPAIPLESLDDVTWSRFKELALGVKQRIETAGA